MLSTEYYSHKDVYNEKNLSRQGSFHILTFFFDKQPSGSSLGPRPAEGERGSAGGAGAPHGPAGAEPGGAGGPEAGEGAAAAQQPGEPDADGGPAAQQGPALQVLDHSSHILMGQRSLWAGLPGPGVTADQHNSWGKPKLV